MVSYIEHDGCISNLDKCWLCDESIQWYAPVAKEHKNHTGVKADLIAFQQDVILSQFKSKKIEVHFNVIAECPTCGIRNKFYFKYLKEINC